jgi:hypothetical protein
VAAEVRRARVCGFNLIRGVAGREMAMEEFEGVLLNVNGTLVDSNEAHAHSWLTAFSKHEIDSPSARIRHALSFVRGQGA